MTATNHVLTGMVIGSVVSSPFVALPLAFFSHFVLDALPHYGLKRQDDRKFLYYLSLDAGTAAGLLLVIVFLQPSAWLLIIASGIACASPDLMWFPDWVRLISNHKKKSPGIVKRLHAKVQWAEKNAWWGIAFEVFWFIIMFFTLSQTIK
jgi:hypothetical protein